MPDPTRDELDAPASPMVTAGEPQSDPWGQWMAGGSCPTCGTDSRHRFGCALMRWLMPGRICTCDRHSAARPVPTPSDAITKEKRSQ
jgi:hypothetical protein